MIDLLLAKIGERRNSFCTTYQGQAFSEHLPRKGILKAENTCFCLLFLQLVVKRYYWIYVRSSVIILQFLEPKEKRDSDSDMIYEEKKHVYIPTKQRTHTNERKNTHVRRENCY
jgi:hypothetical protein